MSKEKTWLVIYEGRGIELSSEEYAELRLLAVDDPVQADAKAREYVKRERERDAAAEKLPVSGRDEKE